MIPIIHIHYSSYLDVIYKVWIRSDLRYRDWVFPQVGDVKDKAELFSRSWSKVGPNLIRQLCKITGLTYKRNQIPVYVVSSNIRTFSDPIVIRSGYSEDEFIEMVIHELIHCLFVDNVGSNFVNNIDQFGDHVVVYAVMESVVPGTIDKLVDTVNFPSNIKYAEAASIVRRHGYKCIIEKCKGTIESCR